MGACPGSENETSVSRRSLYTAVYLSESSKHMLGTRSAAETNVLKLAIFVFSTSLSRSLAIV